MYTDEGGVEAPPTLSTPRECCRTSKLQATLKSIKDAQRRSKEEREKLGFPSGPV